MPLIPTQEPPYYQITTEPGGADVKIYRAILNQSSTAAPIPTIIYNTLGDITWSYQATGEYNGTLTGEFPITKTWLQITPSSANGVLLAVIKRTNDDTITYNTANTTPALLNGGTVFIDIQVKQS